MTARERTGRMRGVSWWKNAFAMEKPGDFRPTARQEELVKKVAAKIVERQVASPAVLFLETIKPLNHVGSQAMLFLAPIVRPLFTSTDYDEVAAFLEHREAIEILIGRIEAKAAAERTATRTGVTPSREANGRGDRKETGGTK